MRLIDTYEYYKDNEEECAPFKMDYDSEYEIEVLSIWLNNVKVLEVIHEGYAKDAAVLTGLDKKEPEKRNLEISDKTMVNIDLFVAIIEDYLEREEEIISSLLEGVGTYMMSGHV